MSPTFSINNKKDVIDKFLTICRVIHYPAKTTIIKPGDSANSLFYVIAGSLSISMKGADNKLYTLAHLNSGDFIGEMGMYITPSQREVFIQSKTDCTLAKVSYPLLWDSLDHELRDCAVGFLKIIGTNLSNRLLNSDRRILNLTSQDVLGRITHALRELCKQPTAIQHPLGIQLKISRNELSSMVGCSRERASKAITSLKKKGLIASEGRSIIVLAEKVIHTDKQKDSAL